MDVSIVSRGSGILCYDPVIYMYHGVISGRWDPLDPIETTRDSHSKQIYHSWEALVESMGSEVPSTVLFSEGRSPEENSTVEGTEGP